MNKILLKLKKLSLNGNNIKIIAIISMIIDHIGYYFKAYIPYAIYYAIRVIGRIAMPLFAFLIVQGFFHTKNIKKYILKVFVFAVITQIAIFAVSLFDNNSGDLSVNKQLNILFSYTLSLITLWLIHEKIIIKKFDYNKNLLTKILLILVIIGVFLFIPIDYEIYVPLLIVMLYLIEKLRITIYLQKQNYTMSMGKILSSFISEDKIKIGYIFLVTIALITIIIRSNNSMYWYMLLSIPVIWLYNGERGNSNKKINYIFYAIFPIQHFLIYLLSIL